MKVFDFPQRSTQWIEARRGVITSSELGQWVAEKPDCGLTIKQICIHLDLLEIEYGPKPKRDDLLAKLPEEIILANTGYSKGWETAVRNLCKVKLAEISGCEMPPEKDNWAMRRGKQLEPEARENYVIRSGETVEEVGFILSDIPNVGASTDGLISGRKGVLEIKCPIPATHVDYLLDEVLPKEHEAQVHAEMAVANAEFADFYSYCPGLPSFYLRVERSELTEAYRAGLEAVSGELEKYKRIMARKWDEMKAEFKKREEAA